MKAFYEGIHFEEFQPYTNPDNQKETSLFAQWAPLVTINKNQDRMVIYYVDSTRMTTKVKGLQSGLYRTRWFNPRTGEYTDASENLIPIHGDWELPDKKDNDDWLLVAERQES